MNDQVSFIFPAKTEYISAIRLATSGVACNVDFDLGKIEDIKSCIAEACILLMCAQTCESLSILLECNGEIRAHVSAVGATRVSPGEECVEFNSELSKIMIEALSEDVSFVRHDDVLREVDFVVRKDSEA
jgi:hypothetical protein